MAQILGASTALLKARMMVRPNGDSRQGFEASSLTAFLSQNCLRTFACYREGESTVKDREFLREARNMADHPEPYPLFVSSTC